MNNPTEPRFSQSRIRSAVGLSAGIAVLGYLAYALWHGMADTAAVFRTFHWGWYVVVLLLTLVNYGLRYVKWDYLLKRLDIHVPSRQNMLIFLCGLGLVVTPGKAGELIKPYLAKEATGTPMMRAVPALVAERLTDGFAVVMLAAVGVSLYRPDQTWLILGTLAVGFVGWAVVSVQSISRPLLALCHHIPVIKRIAPKLDEAYDALHTCLSPGPFAWTLVISLVAWWAECLGYWLVFVGMDQAGVGLGPTTFLYAFATVFGAPSPGGMGMADVALVEGATLMMPGVTEAQALAAALLVRVATLWFGVILGAFALMTIGRWSQQHQQQAQQVP